MKMDMRNGLSGISAAVVDHAIAVLADAQLICDFGDGTQDLAQDLFTIWMTGQGVQVRHMRFGYNQGMDRGLGMHVMKRNDRLIFINELDGDLSAG